MFQMLTQNPLNHSIVLVVGNYLLVAALLVSAIYNSKHGRRGLSVLLVGWMLIEVISALYTVPAIRDLTGPLVQLTYLVLTIAGGIAAFLGLVGAIAAFTQSTWTQKLFGFTGYLSLATATAHYAYLNGYFALKDSNKWLASVLDDLSVLAQVALLVLLPAFVLSAIALLIHKGFSGRKSKKAQKSQFNYS